MRHFRSLSCSQHRYRMDTVDYSFGQWLQRRRLALHLTQQQLGQLAGWSAAMIRKIEADERRPSADVLRLLAEALQIPNADRPVFQRFAHGDLGDMPALPTPPTAPPPNRLNPINLPVPLTSLIGREREVANVRMLLEQKDVRLVTLT